VVVLDPRDVLQSFRFSVALTTSPDSAGGSGGTTLGDGAFQECSGLELEADIREYLEGGRNDGVIRRVGRVKLQPIILKRGMFSPEAGKPVNAELWAWLQDMVAGRGVRRISGTIRVGASRKDESALATWRFDRGLPAKISGPALNAKTGEIAIEELHILHEGLRLVP
jgi:phage tail-like protein